MQNIFSATQYKLLGLCFVLLVAGYICLAQGPVDNPLSVTVAPLLLVGTYCILIPMVILFKGKNQSQSTPKKQGV